MINEFPVWNSKSIKPRWWDIGQTRRVFDFKWNYFNKLPSKVHSTSCKTGKNGIIALRFGSLLWRIYFFKSSFYEFGLTVAWCNKEMRSGRVFFQLLRRCQGTLSLLHIQLSIYSDLPNSNKGLNSHTNVIHICQKLKAKGWVSLLVLKNPLQLAMSCRWPRFGRAVLFTYTILDGVAVKLSSLGWNSNENLAFKIVTLSHVTTFVLKYIKYSEGF